MVELRVISIGTLAAHPLWGERRPVRTGHSTTTLIRVGTETILVDPGLPEQALIARLGERANLSPDDITTVFLTSFHPDARRGIGAFEDARWLIAHAEREQVGVPMVSALRHAVEQGHDELREALERDVAILHRCEEAPESLGDGVDLFPLPGVTPGLTGLLIDDRGDTVLVCGDAVPTIEHVRARRVPPNVVNVDAARASFSEALEISDFLVLGRDNMIPSPGGGGGGAGPGDESLEDDEENDEDEDANDSRHDDEDGV